MMIYELPTKQEFVSDESPRVLWTDVVIEMLSAETIRAAYRYVELVEQYDSSAYHTAGYSPHEWELRRRKAHEKLMAQLRKDHVELGVNERSNSRDVAEKIRRWLRDED